MKALRNLVGGLAGAAALNIVHETVRHLVNTAPRVDLLGEEALSKGLRKTGVTPPSGTKLYLATLAADVVSNAVYYSIVGYGKKKHLLARGAAYGLAAGVGALTLPKPMGLSNAPVTRTNTTKALTVAWYLLGGLVTAAVIKKAL